MAEKRLIDGRYRLDEVVGSGGMGVVWRAFDERLGRAVAVKEVRFPSAMTEEERAELVKRAMIEAQSAGRLDHPHIVAVHDVIVDDQRPFIVMRLVDGYSLDQLVAADGPLNPASTAAIGLQLLDALDTAHAASIVHRDVKPQNVLINQDGKALLTDFSIAAVFGSETLTKTGVLLGSPGYIPPERLMSGQSGVPGDLFALGATLYFAVEGVGPFVANEAMARLFATALQPHREPERAGALVPVLDGLLAKNPDDRLTSPQVRQLLAEIAEGPRRISEPPGEYVPPPVPLRADSGSGEWGSPQGDPPSDASTAAFNVGPAPLAGAAPAEAVADGPAPLGWGSAAAATPDEYPRPPGPPIGPKPRDARNLLLAMLSVIALAAVGLATFLVATRGNTADRNLSQYETLSPSLNAGPVVTTSASSPTASASPSPTDQATQSPATVADQPSPSTSSPQYDVPVVKSGVITLPKSSYHGDCTDFDIQVTVTITLTSGPATLSYQVHQGGGEAYNGDAGLVDNLTITKTVTFHQHLARTGNRTYFLTVQKPIWFDAKPVKFHMDCVPTTPTPTPSVGVS